MSRAKPQKKTAKDSSAAKTENAKAVAAIIAPSGPPVISSCQPSTLPAGIETIVTLTGQNLPGVLAGYTIANTENQGVSGFALRFATLPTQTSVKLGITVGANVAPDTYLILVLGALGTASAGISVTNKKAPIISSLSPNVIDVYSTLVLVPVTLNGNNLPMSSRHYYINASGVGLSLDNALSPVNVRVLFALDPARVRTGDYQLSAFDSAGASAMTIHINKH